MTKHRHFEIITPKGQSAMVHGDPNMPQETAAALARMIDLAAAQFGGVSPETEKEPVYVDSAFIPYGRMLMCHMMSKDLNELHAMADRLGIRQWFQDKKGGTPHYDVSKVKRELALKFGAKEMDDKKVVEIIHYWREQRKTEPA